MKPWVTIVVLVVVLAGLALFFSKSCASQFKLKADGIQLPGIGQDGPPEGQFGLYANKEWNRPLKLITNDRSGGDCVKAWDVAEPDEIVQTGTSCFLYYYPLNRAMSSDTEWKLLDPPHDAGPELIEFSIMEYPQGDIGVGQLLFSKPGRYAFVHWDQGVYLFEVK